MPQNKITLYVAVCLISVCSGYGTAIAQNNYVSPFGTGSIAPNITVAPPYGYGGYQGGGYQGGGYNTPGYMGNGGSNTYGQPQNSLGQGYGNNNQQGYTSSREQGGAPVATPAPVAGGNSPTGNTPANGNPSSANSSDVASPSAAARGSIREGDVLKGNAQALSGSVIMVEGVKISLSETSSPSLDMLCSSSGSSTWKCGERAKEILNKILSYGPVICTLTSAGLPAVANCLIGYDDVSQLAVQEGAAYSSNLKYKAYSAEAMNDRRGIWAKGR